MDQGIKFHMTTLGPPTNPWAPELARYDVGAAKQERVLNPYDATEYEHLDYRQGYAQFLSQFTTKNGHDRYTVRRN